MKRLLCAVVGSLAFATQASAAVTMTLDTITPVGSEYEFSYSGTLAGDAGLVSGSKFVIFDFGGYVPGSISAGIYAADLAATIENTSAMLLPFGQTDDASIPNLVFTWTGAPFNALGGPFADVSFAGLTARSIFNSIRSDAYSSVGVTNNGAATGEPTFTLGQVAVPFGDSPVPEPSTWAMMILGFAGIGAALRSRRRARPFGTVERLA